MQLILARAPDRRRAVQKVCPTAMRSIASLAIHIIKRRSVPQQWRRRRRGRRARKPPHTRQLAVCPSHYIKGTYVQEEASGVEEENHLGCRGKQNWIISAASHCCEPLLLATAASMLASAVSSSVRFEVFEVPTHQGAGGSERSRLIDR